MAKQCWTAATCGFFLWRLVLGVAPEAFGGEVALLTAIKLYELGRLSAGAAAALAHLPKPVVLSKLAEYGANTFTETDEELQRDVERAGGHK